MINLKLILLTIAVIYVKQVSALASDEPLLSIPLNVAVWLSGFPDVGEGALETLLVEMLPRYAPTVENNIPVNDIQFKINYVVHKAPEVFMVHYEAYINDNAPEADGNRLLIIDDLAGFIEHEVHDAKFESQLQALSFDDPFALPIFIVYSETLPPHSIVSTLDKSEIGDCTMSVVGSVAFMDLSAKVCELSAFIASEPKQFRWASPNIKQPYPFIFPTQKSSDAYTPTGEVYLNHIMARLAGIIVSGVQSLTMGSLKWRPAFSATKIYVPIIILHHGATEEGDEVHILSPDLEAINKWVSSLLLPNQELVLLSSDHLIDDHPMVSVALSSSQLTYAAYVEADDEILQKHLEKIPYLDSNILFHELTSVGDSLCNVLLSQTGHGDMLQHLMLIDMNKGQQEEIKRSKAYTIQRKKYDLEEKLKKMRGAIVLPVFVLSDMYISHARHLQRNTSSLDYLKMQFPSLVHDEPVQPLLNRDSAIAIDEDSAAVIVLHSSIPRVSIYSPHIHYWKLEDMSDVNALIAEGITRALTGLNAPHNQLLESRSVVDLTWTHGTHPFNPFGKLLHEAVAQPQSLHGVIAAASRRSILVSRAHRLMQQALNLIHRSEALQREITDVIQYTDSLAIGTGYDSLTSKGTLQMSPGEIAMKIIPDFKVLMQDSLKFLLKKHESILNRLQDVKSRIASSSAMDLANLFNKMDASFQETEEEMSRGETEIHLQLKNCHVSFDYHPLTMTTTSATYGKDNKQTITSSNTVGKTNRVNYFNKFFWIIGLATLAGIGVSIFSLMEYLQNSAKKLKKRRD